MADLLESVIWVGLLGAVALPLRAVWAHSSALMWAAALCTMVISVAGMYSVGAIVFLLVCLELGAAIALRWRASGRGWAACLAAAATVWLAVVPAQIAGPVWLPWVAAFPVSFACGSLALRSSPPRGLTQSHG